MRSGDFGLSMRFGSVDSSSMRSGDFGSSTRSESGDGSSMRSGDFGSSIWFSLVYISIYPLLNQILFFWFHVENSKLTISIDFNIPSLYHFITLNKNYLGD